MKELFNWSTAELEKIEKAHPYTPGVLDGGESAAQKAHIKEYNDRITALHMKYGNTPVTKAQTFNRLIQKVNA
jgi:hypothetical protein